MSTDFFCIYSGLEHSMSTMECLNRSSFDELVEVDLAANRCHNIYHVEGKYFVPITNGTYLDLFRYCADHMIHPDDRQIFVDLMEPSTLAQRLADTPDPGILSAQFRYKLLSGGWRWVEQLVVGGPRHGFPPDVIQFFVYDIQNQKDRELGLSASTPLRQDRDELTGLLREKAFFALAQERIEAGLEGWCLMVMDIQHFKLFNDWYGRGAGDLLLAEIGALLKHTVDREGGMAGYLGQDDFSLLIPFSKERVDALYEGIHNLIAARGVSFGFLPAFGISLIEGKPPVLDLLDEASLAAAQLKGDFHSRIRLFRPEMREKTEEEYRLLLNFQRGLKSGELFFVLQPQCRISTGQVVGAECLARWRAPDGKMISPADFIPILEKYGFITDLDQYIWEQVCIWLRKRMDAGHPSVPISINVSQVDIFRTDVPDYLERLLVKYGLPKESIKVEITESAYVENGAAVRDTVARLREMGFLVLMDDFGSGYSSLNMLHEINVDVIKLDAQFLRLNHSDEEKGIHIVESIFNMTKTMAIPVIVEGVETTEQTNFLADLGCRYIQGYHFYRPMPVSDFETLISDDRKVDHQGISFKANQQFSIREFLDQNVYSDSMLNNILGPSAIYSRTGDNVDIVRFNEQFYQEVNVPNFHNRLAHIQDYIYPGDLAAFYSLLDQAEADRLNGASGMVGVYRTDGSLGQYILHVYFLEEGETDKKFYATLQDVTEITTLQRQMELLSRFSTDSIVFLRSHSAKERYQVAVHGLRDFLGLTQEDFQRELNTGRFSQRVEDSDLREQLREIARTSAAEKRSFHFSFRLKNARGEWVGLLVKTDYVHDEYSDVEHIVIFRKQED